MAQQFARVKSRSTLRSTSIQVPFSISRTKETSLSEQSFVPFFNQLFGSKELRNFLMSGMRQHVHNKLLVSSRSCDNDYSRLTQRTHAPSHCQSHTLQTHLKHQYSLSCLFAKRSSNAPSRRLGENTRSVEHRSDILTTCSRGSCNPRHDVELISLVRGAALERESSVPIFSPMFVVFGSWSLPVPFSFSPWLPASAPQVGRPFAFRLTTFASSFLALLCCPVYS